MITKGRSACFTLLSSALLCCAASRGAMAAEVWKEVVTDDEGITYAAPDTLSQHSGIKSMWELRDYKTGNNTLANGTVYMSRIRLVDYHCDKRKLLVTEESFFSENMSKGRLIDRVGAVMGGEEKLVAAEPHSSEAAMMSLACAGPAPSYANALFQRVLTKLADFGIPVPAAITSLRIFP